MVLPKRMFIFFILFEQLAKNVFHKGQKTPLRTVGVEKRPNFLSADVLELFIAGCVIYDHFTGG